MKPLAICDFETHAIQNRPEYPPKPTSIAIIYPNGLKRFLCWGHPTGNNTTEEAAKQVVLQTVKDYRSCWHNAKFDTEVLQKWTGYTIPPEDWDDTMLMAFLCDPHSMSLALKPLGEKLLGLPPEERDAVKDWILANVPAAKRKPSTWGAYICEAPGDLVGQYALGDVERTQKLYDLLHAKIVAGGMEKAYLREKRLIPILIENEQQGIPCDVPNLETHLHECEEDLQRTDAWIGQYLGVQGINLDENETLADALEAKGLVTKWELTEKGARSTAKPALDRMLSDRVLYAALMYRGSMATCVRTFMRPWLELAHSNNGRLYTTWNTTKQEEGGGTRTGRLSSSKPLNLQNIPNDFDEKFGELFAVTGVLDLMDVGELPVLRNYITADSRDHVLLGRDFSSQEPRTFAHFEAGWMQQRYNANPKMDVYRELMAITQQAAGMGITRKHAKTCIAEGELVLTDVGLVPIEQVTTQHHVWDGLDFVRHTGVICQGTKEVITYDGLTATPDHIVWTTDGRKIPFGDAASRLAKLATTGDAGEAIRFVDASVSGDFEESEEALLDGSVRLREGGVYSLGEPQAGAIHQVQALSQREGGALQGVGGKIRRYCVEVREGIRSKLQELRRSRDRVSLFLTGGICQVGFGEPSTQGLPWGRDRQGGQQRSLRAGEFATSFAARADVQLAQECENRLLRDECLHYSHVAPTEDRPPIYVLRSRKDDEETFVRATVAGDCGAAGTSKRWAKVYDITNAGPKNRFTVSGKLVSNCFLGILYGMGKDKLAIQLGTSPQEAQAIKNALLTAVPSIGEISDMVKHELKSGSFVRTWGGRQYYVEPDKTINNEKRTFEYKGLNVLVQGSAADETKEALIRYYSEKTSSRLLLQVHDELVISAPKEDAAKEMATLRRCMEGLELSVPLLSEGESGYRWGQMEAYAE